MGRNNGSQVKWGIYALSYLVMYFIKICILNRIPIYGALPELAPLVVAAVGCYEGSLGGALYGLGVGFFCSAVYFRGGTMMIPICTVTGVLAGLTTRRQIGKNFLGVVLCGAMGVLVLGGPLGGLAGAIGMSIGDLLDPIYIVYVPKTFILKLCIGLISGGVAHGLGKINRQTDQKKIFGWALAAAIAGLAFNVVFDPLLGYYYKLLILGKPAADLTLAWNIGATSINAVISTVVSVLVYTLLRPALTKAGVMRQIWGDKFAA